LKSVLGAKLGTEPEQFRESRYIIAWAGNIHGNNVHLWPFVEEARRKGAKLVVIDPYKTRTAKCADWYLPINPGTDAALALGMMHVILREGLEDRAYINAMALGFDQLAERVRDLLVQFIVGVAARPHDQRRRMRYRFGVQDRRGVELLIHPCSPPSIA